MLVHVATSPAGKWLPADRDLKKNASRFFTAAYRGSGQEGRDADDVKKGGWE